MIHQGALGEEVHEAAVGEIWAALDLKSGEVGAPPCQDGQSPVRQAGAPGQVRDLEVVVGLGGGVPGQKPDDGLEGEVRIDQGPVHVVRQLNPAPQLGLPREEVEAAGDPAK